ncbi:toxin VasX [Ketobacter sp.]|uniref:toxin VasX n=1 Tax=Ketobacter sp. TaxID=2083498 RepID=UPI0025C3A14A|nr:toxin VasX [Ketobacter sp.]
MTTNQTPPAAGVEPRPVALNEVNTLVVGTIVTPIYPVRYAYANFFEESLLAPTEPPPLSAMLDAADLNSTNGYVPRLLRPGWIYIREEDGPNGGHFQIFKYAPVENNGQLEERFPKYQFANGVNAQGGLKEDTSGGIKGGYPFVFVRKEVTEISIAYSEHEWHPNIIDKMNGDAGERAASMQRIKLKSDDPAAVPATADNLARLVEDYREQKARLLRIKNSSTDPSVKDLALDVLTTQSSYDMDADQIALALRRKTKPGETARVVALHDPVGRQRDIAEVHAKLALWEKAYASQNLYPFTIGQLVGQLKQSNDEALQDVLKESINWGEYDQYWTRIEQEFKGFATRQEQFAELYRGFMHGSGVTGKVGSLDNYFQKFFCQNATKGDEATAELTKLCEIGAGIFNGILSSDRGNSALEKILEDFNNEKNAYVAFFDVFKGIVTAPQNKLDWAAKVGAGMDKLLQQLGPLWAKIAVFSIYEAQVSVRAKNRFLANVYKYTVNQVIPYVHQAMGMTVDNANRVRYTPEKLGQILAEQIEASARSYPGTAGDDVLKAAEKALSRAQKMFDWGQKTQKTTIPRYVELSEIEITRLPGKRFSFVVPKSVGEGIGVAAESGFAGLSAYANCHAIYDLYFQAEYYDNDPLQRGHTVHGLIQFASAVTSLTVDVLTISRAAVGVSAKVTSNASNQVIASLAPKLSERASALGTLLGSQMLSRVIVVANFASATASVWNGINSWQGDNRGEAAGHFTLALGSVVIAAATIYGVGAAATTAGGGATATGVGAVPGLIAVGVGLLCLGAGATLLWVYGKSDFQRLLENCFWGVSSRYGFWEFVEERPGIDRRIDNAKEMKSNSKMLSAYKIELQEFMNYLNMPALELSDTEGWFDTSGDTRTFSLKFSLPRFQIGVSDILFELRTRHIDFDVFSAGVWRENKALTEKLGKAMESARFEERDGFTNVEVEFETQEDIELFWAYKPTPNTVVPMRYLTDDGLIESPVVGMINEEVA